LKTLGIINPAAEEYLVANGYSTYASLEEAPPTENDLIDRCKFTLREKNLILSKIRVSGGLELPPIPKSIQPEAKPKNEESSPKKKKKKTFSYPQ